MTIEIVEGREVKVYYRVTKKEEVTDNFIERHYYRQYVSEYK